MFNELHFPHVEVVFNGQKDNFQQQLTCMSCCHCVMCCLIVFWCFLFVYGYFSDTNRRLVDWL